MSKGPLTEGKVRGTVKGGGSSMCPTKTPPSSKVNKRVMGLKDLPQTEQLYPFNLDDELPITTKQVYGLVKFLTDGGECPDLLFKVDGVHYKGKL